jgi:hypothetical protein
MINAARSNGQGIEWLVTSGPNAHAGIAFLKYYTDVSKNAGFLNDAKAIASFLLKLQDKNTGDFGYGGIFMGPKGDRRYPGDQHPGYNQSAPGYEEILSTEHNIDCFHFFDKLYSITGDVKYQTARDGVLGFITKMYDPSRRVFNMGYNERDNIVDNQVATDVQAWGISSSGCARIEAITGLSIEDFVASMDSWGKANAEGYCMTSSNRSIVSPEFSLEAAAAKLQAANYVESKGRDATGLRAGAWETITKMTELSRGSLFHYCYNTDYSPADNADTGLGFRAQQGDAGISHFYLLNLRMGNDILSEIKLFSLT